MHFRISKKAFIRCEELTTRTYHFYYELTIMKFHAEQINFEVRTSEIFNTFFLPSNDEVKPLWYYELVYRYNTSILHHALYDGQCGFCRQME